VRTSTSAPGASSSAVTIDMFGSPELLA